MRNQYFIGLLAFLAWGCVVERANAVGCAVGDIGDDRVVVRVPANLTSHVLSNGCAEYIVRSTTPNDQETEIRGPVLISNVDAVISGGWDDLSLIFDNPLQTSRRTTVFASAAPGFIITADPNGPRRTVVLDNLHIEDSGNRFGSEGGGIEVRGPVDLYLRNMRIQENGALRGGGIFLSDGAVLRRFEDSSPPEFTQIDVGTFDPGASHMIAPGGNELENNSADHGAGVYCRDASVDISGGFDFTRNIAGQSGGAFFLTNCKDFRLNQISARRNAVGLAVGGGLYAVNSGSAEITNSTFVDNVAETGGGGLYLQETGADLSDTTISDNRSDQLNGGGVYCEAINNDKALTLSSTFINNNRTALAGGGIYASGCDLINHPTRPLAAVEIVGNQVNADFSDPSFEEHANLHAGGGIFLRLARMELGDLDRGVRLRIADNHVSQVGGPSDPDNIVRNPPIGTNQTLVSAGGGIEAHDSSLVLENFTLSNNRAHLGAALNLAVRSEAVLTDGLISDNHATGLDLSAYLDFDCVDGRGAVAVSVIKFVSQLRQDLVANRVSMLRNKGYSCGRFPNRGHASALYVDRANARLENVVIFDDPGDESKFAISLEDDYDVALTHSTVVTHPFFSALGDGIMEVRGSSDADEVLRLKNSLFYNAGKPLLVASSNALERVEADCVAMSASLQNSGLQNISNEFDLSNYQATDPESFADFQGLLNGDLRLTDESSLIDQCDLPALDQARLERDRDRNPRPISAVGEEEGPFYDLGAFEHQDGEAVVTNLSVSHGAPSPQELSTSGTLVGYSVRNLGLAADEVNLTISAVGGDATVSFSSFGAGSETDWVCSPTTDFEVFCSKDSLLLGGGVDVLRFGVTPDVAQDDVALEVRVATSSAELIVTDNELIINYGVVDDITPLPDALFADGFE